MLNGIVGYVVSSSARYVRLGKVGTDSEELFYSFQNMEVNVRWITFLIVQLRSVARSMQTFGRRSLANYNCLLFKNLLIWFILWLLLLFSRVTICLLFRRFKVRCFNLGAPPLMAQLEAAPKAHQDFCFRPSDRRFASARRENLRSLIGECSD